MMEESRGIPLGLRDRLEARFLVAILSDLQDTARIPDEVITVFLERAKVLEGVEKGGPGEPRIERIAQIGDRANQADLRRGTPLALVDDGHLPPARSEPFRGERAGEPCADHYGATLAGRDRCRAAAIPGEHLALGPEARALLHAKSGAGERRSDAPGDGPRRQRRIGAASRASSRTTSGDHISGLRAGAKPSRKKASTRASTFANSSRASPSTNVRITRPPSKCRRWNPASGGGHASRSACASAESSSNGASAASRSSCANGCFSMEDEMHPRRAPRILAPRLPRREEIQPDAESGFENRERIAPTPAFGQRIAAQEDVARLAEPAFTRVVDIVEFGAEGGRPRSCARSGRESRKSVARPSHILGDGRDRLPA
jgi:hypothetical protein